MKNIFLTQKSSQHSWKKYKEKIEAKEIICATRELVQSGVARERISTLSVRALFDLQHQPWGNGKKLCLPLSPLVIFPLFLPSSFRLPLAPTAFSAATEQRSSPRVAGILFLSLPPSFPYKESSALQGFPSARSIQWIPTRSWGVIWLRKSAFFDTMWKTICFIFIRFASVLFILIMWEIDIH